MTELRVNMSNGREVIVPGTSTITITEEENVPQTEPTLHLRLRKPRSSREVHWANGTVDNEGMDKKKSKCCCIYEKPRAFNESSSESEDDECDHCRGHVEKKAKKLKTDTLAQSRPTDAPEASSAKRPSQHSDKSS